MQCNSIKILNWPTLSLHHTIPKLIHQTWKTRDLPKHWLPSSEAWQKLHPDWTYVFWTDSDIDEYIYKAWPQKYALWRNLPHAIQRVDLWRYFVLHDFGGLYADLDIMPIENVESHLCHLHIGLIPSANTASVYTNAIMVSSCSAESKAFWTSMISHVSKFPETSLDHIGLGLRHSEIMMSTGPLGLTAVANVSMVPITVLPSRVWNAYDLSLAGSLHEQDSIGSIIKILEGSSWHAPDSTILTFIFLHLRPIVCLLVLGLVLFFIRSSIVREKFDILKRRFQKLLNKK